MVMTDYINGKETEMRLWMTDPKLMCRQHLLGEHRECHTFVGSINNGHNVSGYLNGLVDPRLIEQRHDELVKEMIRRGYNHHSPLADYDHTIVGHVDPEENLKELHRRCPACRALIDKSECSSVW